jgi:hypothetical protein
MAPLYLVHNVRKQAVHAYAGCIRFILPFGG